MWFSGVVMDRIVLGFYTDSQNVFTVRKDESSESKTLHKKANPLHLIIVLMRYMYLLLV